MPEVWEISMLGINGVLLAFGLSLAWRTRNIYITAANDSKYIGLAVYNVSVFAGTAVLIGLAVTNATIRFGMLSAFILLSTTGSICLIFIPKVCHFHDLWL